LPEALEAIQEKGTELLEAEGMPRMSFEELEALERGEVPERLLPYAEQLGIPTPREERWGTEAMFGEGVTIPPPPPGLELELETPSAAAVEEWAAHLTAVYGEEAGLSAAATAGTWVSEYEAAMAGYDNVLQSIGMGGGEALATGVLAASEDVGSEFLVSIARQMAPELVPYVLAAIAARTATKEPVE
jgi:hypothetical protein